MMDSIRQWALGVCAAAVACGLAQMLLPKSAMQRVFNITVSVFFLTCLLSPVLLTLPSIDFAPPPDLQAEIDRRSASLSSATERQRETLSAEGVRLAARHELEKMGIEDAEIYINVHEDGQDGISISECELKLANAYLPRHDEIRATLRERLGVNVLIGYKEG